MFRAVFLTGIHLLLFDMIHMKIRQNGISITGIHLLLFDMIHMKIRQNGISIT